MNENNENERPASRKQWRFIKKFSPPPSRSASPQLMKNIQGAQPITEVLYPPRPPSKGGKHSKKYRKTKRNRSRKTKRTK